MATPVNDLTGTLPRLQQAGASFQVLETDIRNMRPKVLELSNLLQRSLEIDELIRTLDKEIRRLLRYEGLRFVCDRIDTSIMVGREAADVASYQLEINGESLGELRFHRTGPFSHSQLQRLEHLLCALVYPLRNALKYQEAIRSSMIDPLTGIENRGAMDAALRREIDLSRRQDSPMSVILFDIDFFKRINDEFGHAAGDEALKAVVRCTKQTIRSSDLMFRYGGEEFLVLLSHTHSEGAELLAERIRANIEQNCRALPNGAPLTISLGVATLNDRETEMGLFQRADAALYEAKRAGRNRVFRTVD